MIMMIIRLADRLENFFKLISLRVPDTQFMLTFSTHTVRNTIEMYPELTLTAIKCINWKNITSLIILPTLVLKYFTQILWHISQHSTNLNQQNWITNVGSNITRYLLLINPSAYSKETYHKYIIITMYVTRSVGTDVQASFYVYKYIIQTAIEL